MELNHQCEHLLNCLCRCAVVSGEGPEEEDEVPENA